MKDQTLFRLVPVGFVAVLVTCGAAIVGAIYVLFTAGRALLAGSFVGFLLSAVMSLVVWLTWEFGAVLAANLITNRSVGYRPWTWGMQPITQFGRSAAEFDVPLKYQQVKENFSYATSQAVTGV